VTVYIRNLSARRTLTIPLDPGLCRVLPPAVTSIVPARVLAQPAVQALLARQFLARVDVAGWDPDERQRRALKADMAAAIARAEQAEVDKLRVGIRLKPRRAPTGRPRYRWTSQRIAKFKALWDARATPDEIAHAMDMGKESVFTIASKLGLSRRAPRPQSGLGAGYRASRKPEEIRTPEIAVAA
jgi:hypothetical protein